MLSLSRLKLIVLLVSMCNDVTTQALSFLCSYARWLRLIFYPCQERDLHHGNDELTQLIDLDHSFG